MVNHFRSKLCLFLCTLCIIFLWTPLPLLAEETKEEKSQSDELIKQLYAHSAILMDADSGRVLLEKNGDEILPMASTTKIMTCILVLEYGNLDDIAYASSYAASMPKVKLGAKKGEGIRVGDLLYSLMLESHNDSAVMLAEYLCCVHNADVSTDTVAKASVEESKESILSFAEMMNKKADEIGCTNTCFLTPNGLDATNTVIKEGESLLLEHSTTAKDLALIMRYCTWFSVQKEQFLQVTQTKEYQFSSVDLEGNSYRNYHCYNHNGFLQRMEGVLSGKTGFTNKAGYCYTASIEQAGEKYVVVLLACGWPPHKTYKWEDTKKLFEYGLENYEYRNYKEEYCYPELAVYNGLGKTVALEVQNGEEPLSLLTCKEDVVTVRRILQEQVKAPVEKGMLVGVEGYYLNGELVKSYFVVTSQTVREKIFSEYLLDVFRCWIFKK